MLKDLQLWNFILQGLVKDQRTLLLVVVESEGSSPGRAGYKLAILPDGTIKGSIGGGIMEIKLVELGKKLLQESSLPSFLKKQIHHKQVHQDQSGMICSGEQTVLFYLLTAQDITKIEAIIDLLTSGKDGYYQIKTIHDQSTFEVFPFEKRKEPKLLIQKGEHEFCYSESFSYKAQLYIIGGGHCALALSDLMANLNFFVYVLDDRSDLNTMEQNTSAHHKRVISSYASLADEIPDGEEVYVVVMTLGYRSDIQALLSIRGKTFGYLGVLGSETKIAAIRAELATQDFPSHLLDSMRAPVGLPIHSHSPEEIAVSIAAEIIQHYNNK